MPGSLTRRYPRKLIASIPPLIGLDKRRGGRIAKGGPAGKNRSASATPTSLPLILLAQRSAAKFSCLCCGGAGACLAGVRFGTFGPANSHAVSRNLAGFAAADPTRSSPAPTRLRNHFNANTSTLEAGRLLECLHCSNSRMSSQDTSRLQYQ